MTRYANYTPPSERRQGLYSAGAQPAEADGFIKTLASELGRDFVGAGRTAVAGIGGVFELMGANVPISISDLEARDLKGAGMILAMGAGGLVSTLGRTGIPMINAALKGGSLGYKVGAVSAVEAAAGAAFGLTRTALTPDDSAFLKNALTDGAIGAGFGLGFGMVGHATGAVLKAFKADMRVMQRLQATGPISQLLMVRKKAQEFAGTTLRNPETGETILLWSDPLADESGKSIVKARRYVEGVGEGPGVDLLPEVIYSDDFGRAVGKAASEGFDEIIDSAAKPQYRSINQLREFADDERFPLTGGQLDTLQNSKFVDDDLVGALDIREYQSYYENAGYLVDDLGLRTELAVEAVTRNVDELGVPVYTDSGLKNLLQHMSRRKEAWMQEPRKHSAEILRGAIDDGIINTDKLFGALSIEDGIRFLDAGLVPAGGGTIDSLFMPPDSAKLGIMMKVLSSSKVALSNPELMNIVKEGEYRYTLLDTLNRRIASELAEVGSLVGRNRMVNRTWDTAHDFAVKSAIDGAEEVALKKLQSKGPVYGFIKEVKEAVEDASGVMQEVTREVSTTGSYNQAWAAWQRRLGHSSEDAKTEAIAALKHLNKLWRNEAGKAAPKLARAHSGEAERVTRFAVAKMGTYFDLLEESGQILFGQPSYFPIYNSGTVKAAATTSSGKLKVVGFYDSQEAAAQALREVAEVGNPALGIKPGELVSGEVSNTASSLELTGFSFSPKSRDALLKRERLAVASKFNKNGDYMGQQRKLGYRDFEDMDVFEAMDLYFKSANKRLVLGKLPRSIVDGDESVTAFTQQFEQAVEEQRAIGLWADKGGLVDRVTTQGWVESSTKHQALIPEAKGTVNEWATQFIADVAGQPRKVELAIGEMFSGFGADQRKVKRYLGALRMFENVWRLGGVSALPVQLSQLLINTPTKLGSGGLRRMAKTIYGFTGPQAAEFRESTRLLMEEAGATQSIGMVLGAEWDKGIATTMREIAAEHSKSLSGKLRNMGAHLSLLPFQSAEKINRVVTFRAAYDQAVDSAGMAMSRSDALKWAKDVMLETQFNYHISDMPEILRGPVGATLLQFKSFFIKEMEFIASLNKKELGIFGAMMFSAGGLSGLLNIPGPDLLSLAKGTLFETDLEEDLKIEGLQSLGMPLGSALGNLAVYGIPGLREVNLSDRIGVGGFADQLSFFWGPAVSDLPVFAKTAFDAAIDLAKDGQMNQNTMMGYARKVLPSEVRRFMDAKAVFTDGEVRNWSTRKLIYQPTRRLRESLAMYPLGAPTVRLTQERALDSSMTRIIADYNGRKANITKSIVLAREAGRTAEVESMMADARRRGYNIDGATMRYWTRELQRPGAERRLRRAPTMLRSREEYSDYFRATGELPPPPTR